MAKAKKKVLATVNIRLDFDFKDKPRTNATITFKDRDFYLRKGADKVLHQIMPALSTAFIAAEDHPNIDSKSIRISFHIIEK